MKNLLLSLVALFVLGLTNVNAQGFQGKWFVMGQAGYGTASDGDISNYSVLPVVGTFVAPTTVLGLGVGYLGSTDKTVANIKTTEGAFIVQPLARKYWGMTDNFFLFGQASVPMQFGKTTIETGGVKADSKYSSFGIAIAPGVDYFLSSHFSIEASFGLINWTSFKPKDGDSTNDFSIGVNSGFLDGMKFGLKYIF